MYCLDQRSRFTLSPVPQHSSSLPQVVGTRQHQSFVPSTTPLPFLCLCPSSGSLLKHPEQSSQVTYLPGLKKARTWDKYLVILVFW